MIRYIRNKGKNIFQTKYAWFAGFLILVFLSFKTFDLVVGYFTNPKDEISKSHTEISDSTLLFSEYDSLFANLDQKVEKVVLERNLNATTKEIHKLVEDVKISKPFTPATSGQSYIPTWTFEEDSSKSYRKKKIYTFYIVTNNGYIANRYGAVQYYLPGSGERYFYEITLKEGIYTFITLGINPNDTVPFVIDQNGVYKLGFQESHPNFTIFKDPLP